MTSSDKAANDQDNFKIPSITTFQSTKNIVWAWQSNTQNVADSKWKRVMQSYAEESGIVGLKNVSDNKIHWTKRIIWFVLILLGAGLMISQIVDRVLFYFTFPVMVNIEVKYVKEIAFPAVTICNYNAFRKSMVEANNYTDILKEMYPVSLTTNSSSSTAYLNVDNITSFYLNYAHTKENLIKGCEWQGNVCGPEDFETILTDFGVCYTFNSYENPEKVLKSNNKGAPFGLKLMIDIESDEYTYGPRNSAGIKILLHEQNDLPSGLADDLGFVVAPGTLTLVGLHALNVTNLPSPYGECETKELKYLEKYSVMGCLLDCQTVFAVENCGCKDAFMPGNVPVCTSQQLNECLYPKMKIYIKDFDDYCACQAPCQRTLFNPAVSTGLFPDIHSAKEISKQFNISVQEIRENFLLLNIYFEEVKYQMLTQQEAYGIYALLSDIGGSMGLFLGVSVMALFQLVEHLCFGYFRGQDSKKE